MIGFIGAGNMATALIEGFIRGGVDAADVMAYDVSPDRMAYMESIGVKTAPSAAALASGVEITVLAVKPKFMPDLLADLSAHATLRDVLSIAAGWNQEMLEKALPGAQGIAHMMPNTPSQLGEGVLAFNQNHTIEESRFVSLLALFAACGRTVVIAEPLMDAITAVSGSGPAYVYLFIEALADGGVREGLPRDLAYEVAAQTVIGAGKMVLETGRHPGALKDAVSSPAGATIEAIYALEKAGLRGAVLDAVDACAGKMRHMTEQSKGATKP